MNDRTYFNTFPLIDYNGDPATNILRRVDFNNKVKNFITAFYPYTMTTDERVDHVAFNYYQDVDLDWLIYHTNDIVDPYYGVPLSSDDFEKYIKEKYGSIRVAKRKVLFYKNNYESDDSVISTSVYDALASTSNLNETTGEIDIQNQKKYYDPILSAMGVYAYERSQVDYTVSTNKIISLNFATTISKPFTVGETIEVNNDTLAQVAFSNTSTITLQHIIGDFNKTSNFSFTGDESGVTATANADTYSLILDNIPDTEDVYYSPVYAYDYEEELNEKKRDIYLIDRNYSETMKKQLKEVMK
jgi:hypothetical protein